MFFLLPLIGAAVAAVAGASITHAAGEKDRQKSKHHREVANAICVDRDNLQKRYNELAEESKRKIEDSNGKSQQLIRELNRKNAQIETEKKLLRLALRLQRHVYTLMQDIDEKPSSESLIKLEEAIRSTNKILHELQEESIKVPDGYFSRNLERAKEAKTSLTGDSIDSDLYQVKQCQKCGKKNRIIPHEINLNAICGKCKYGLSEEFCARPIEKETNQAIDRDLSARVLTNRFSPSNTHPVILRKKSSATSIWLL